MEFPMKGWGAQDDFQEQIEATVSDRLAMARADLKGPGCKNCKDCGLPIPEARRIAYPSATQCVPCKSQYE
jgi:phage/conjugal plasmid C-4 type zinc finger TraR family protein